MWHWTTRTGEHPEAVAFTRPVTEPEPTITEAGTGTEQTETTDFEASGRGVCPMSYDLAG